MRADPITMPPTQRAPDRAGASAVPGVAIAVATITSAVVLVGAERVPPLWRAWLIVVGLGAWAVAVAWGWSREPLPLRPVLAAIVIVTACAVVTPSTQSKDVFSYTMYGRMVTEHGHNPFDWYPMHFEGDPMRVYVSPIWQRTPDIYGPAFTVVMVAAAPVIGESTFRARLVYQLIALAAFAALLWLLWKRTRNPTVLAFLGLCPLTTVSILNGGHPDMITALLFLGAFLLALERRPLWCGLLLGLGASINFSMIVVAGAVIVWAFRRWPRAEVVKLAVVSGLVGAVPYVFLPGWRENASEHQELVSRHSVWNPIGSALDPIGWIDMRTVMPKVSTLAAGALMLVVLWRFTKSVTPGPAMAAAAGVFVFTSPWVMPWYAFAAFPLLAMRKPNLLAWTLAGFSTLVLAGDQFPAVSAYAVGSVGHHLLQNVIPLVACGAGIYAIVWSPVPVGPELGVAEQSAATRA